MNQKRTVSENDTGTTVSAMLKWMKQNSFIKGLRVPSERSWSEQLKVSRRAVNNAFKQLEEQKIITAISPRIRTLTGYNPLRNSTIIALVTTWSSMQLISLRNGFQGDSLFLSLTTLIQSSNMNMMLLNPDQTTPSIKEQLQMNRPAGVLLLDDTARPEVYAKLARILEQEQIPTVCSGNLFTTEQEQRCPFDAVFSDQHHGACLITEFLIQQGCKRIQYLGADSGTKATTPYWRRQRLKGYQDTMNRNNLTPLPPLNLLPIGAFADTPESLSARISSTTGVLHSLAAKKKKPDALMLISDHRYEETAAALRTLGMEPQRDLIVTGYDNTWKEKSSGTSEPTSPAVSTHQNAEKFASEMINLLLKRIQSPVETPPQHIFIKPDLVPNTI